MQRTFIALKVNPQREMVDCIQHLRNVLRAEKIKWVDTGNLHITLRFLGDTGTEKVKSIIKILEETVPRYPASEVLFRGVGIFRNLRDPRVLWIGMDPGNVLPGLKENIDRELQSIGFPPEERKFRPHLTLARIKHIREKNPLQDQLQKYRDTIFQKMSVGELIYYESILRPEGPSYLPLAIVNFGR